MDHAFCDERVVVEAKHDQSYTVSADLQELEKARANRGARVGIFDKLASTGGQKLQKLLNDAKKTLLALKVELREEEEDRASPIALAVPANDALAPPEGSESAGSALAIPN